MKNKKQYVVKKYGDALIHIWEPVFRSNFYYVIAPTYAEFGKVVKHHFDIQIAEKEQNEPLGHTTAFPQDEGTLVFIWTKNNSPDVIAHECFHAVAMELLDRGIKLSGDSDELYAYMLQFLMKSILDNIK